MTAPSGGKWIGGISPDDKTSLVARKSLAVRLEAVCRAVSRVARSSHVTREQVHQLRVAARRGVAAITLYAEFLPRRRARWIERRLKRIRKTAGAARDCDVLMDSLQSLPAPEGTAVLVAELARRRALAGEPIIALCRRLHKERRLKRRVRALLKRVRPRIDHAARDDDAAFNDWARTRLRARLQRFLDRSPTDPLDLEALHRFRIQGKKLRYSLELLAPAFAPAAFDALYPNVEALQEKLGQVNDATAVCDFLRHGLEPGGEARLADVARGLLPAWDERLAASCAAFFDWWNPELVERLSSIFEDLLADREESCEPFGYTGHNAIPK